MTAQFTAWYLLSSPIYTSRAWRIIVTKMTALAYNRTPPLPAYTPYEGLDHVSVSGVSQPYWIEKALPMIPVRASSIFSNSANSKHIVYRADTFDQNDSGISWNTTAKLDLDSECTPTNLSIRRRRSKALRHDSLGTVRTQRLSIGIKTFLTEEQYGIGMHLAKANHYFREKKWEIFPELGPRCGDTSDGSISINTTSTSFSSKIHRLRLPKRIKNFQITQIDGFSVKFTPVSDQMRLTIDNIKPVIRRMKSQTRNLKPLCHQIQHSLVKKTSRMQIRCQRRKNDPENNRPRFDGRTSETPPSLRSQFSMSSFRDRHTITARGPFEDEEYSSVFKTKSDRPSTGPIYQRLRKISSRPQISNSHSQVKGGSIGLRKCASSSFSTTISQHEINSTANITGRTGRSYSQPPEYSAKAHGSTSESDISPARILFYERSDTRSPLSHGKDSEVIADPGKKAINFLPEYARHLRSKSKLTTKASLELVSSAYDGALRKISGMQAERRRTEMKKQIRLIRPVERYYDGCITHWVWICENCWEQRVRAIPGYDFLDLDLEW